LGFNRKADRPKERIPGRSVLMMWMPNTRRIRRNKYMLPAFVLLVVVASIVRRAGKYEDWSKINEMLETSCRSGEGWRERCFVDFTEIGFSWDNVYAFGGAEQAGVDALLGSDAVEVDKSCVYLAFTGKNEGVIAVYEQCIDEETHEIFNDVNDVALRVEVPAETYQPLNAICDDYSVSRESNLREVPARYVLACGKESM